ncbi:hypothetical protein BH10PLA2_BH10PLA2_25120 [soil metagenome]
MPRKSKKLSEPAVPPTTLAGEPNPADLPGPTSAATGPAGDKRGAQGYFAKGNSGGPGNPHARQCARMLEMFRNAITDEEMYFLSRILFERASTGDMSALKMVWQYKMGKPLPAPNPDSIDRDEWDHFQKDGTTIDEMKQALGRLPSHVGNAIVSAALPTIASTISQTLSEQLIQSLPPGYWEQRQQQANQSEQVQSEVEAPAQPTSPSVEDPWHIPDFRTYEEPIPNSSDPGPEHTRSSSGSIGNSKLASTPNKPTSTTRKGTGSNGNSTHNSNANRPTNTNKPATGSNGNSKHASTTNRPTNTTKPATGSNGNSKGTKKRNKPKKQWLEPTAQKCNTNPERKKQRLRA